MRHVSSRNTKLEQVVRTFLRKQGVKFSCRNKHLPGKPDIVFRKERTVLFVHGCFWHAHLKCKKGVVRPRKNKSFWEQKLLYNRAKDKRVESELRREGWKVFVLWECETKDFKPLKSLVTRLHAE